MKNSSAESRGENESSVDLREKERGLMLSEHDLSAGLQGHLLAESDCRTLQLSVKQGRRARSVNRLPLLSSMDVVHSQRPHSYMSATLCTMWLLNVFSVCYCSVPQGPAVSELRGWSTNCQPTLEPVKLHHYCLDKTVGITASFCFKDRDLSRLSAAERLTSLSTVSFLFFVLASDECSCGNVCF